MPLVVAGVAIPVALGVIGLLAEYDALPGLPQAAEPVRKPIEGIAGHGCGHNLFGAASVAAAFCASSNRCTVATAGMIVTVGTSLLGGGVAVGSDRRSSVGGGAPRRVGKPATS